MFQIEVALPLYVETVEIYRWSLCRYRFATSFCIKCQCTCTAQILSI